MLSTNLKQIHLMKTCLYGMLALIVATTMATTDGMAQEGDRRVNLRGSWKFSLGDNMKFADPEYNDRDWEEIYVPATWQEEGFRHYNGYAWYRMSFSIEFKKETSSL